MAYNEYKEFVSDISSYRGLSKIAQKFIADSIEEAVDREQPQQHNYFPFTNEIIQPAGNSIKFLTHRWYISGISHAEKILKRDRSIDNVSNGNKFDSIGKH